MGLLNAVRITQEPKPGSGAGGEYVMLKCAHNTKDRKTGEESTMWITVFVSGKWLDAVTALKKGDLIDINAGYGFTREVNADPKFGDQYKCSINAQDIRRLLARAESTEASDTDTPPPRKATGKAPAKGATPAYDF